MIIECLRSHADSKKIPLFAYGLHNATVTIRGVPKILLLQSILAEFQKQIISGKKAEIEHPRPCQKFNRIIHTYSMIYKEY